MDLSVVATKSNLIKAKTSLALSRQGYGLLDKKRNILIRELMSLIQTAEDIQKEIDTTFTEAYAALQRANIAIGINNVEHISNAVAKENSVVIKTRSVMGVAIPIVEYNEDDNLPPFGFSGSGETLDIAYQKFKRVKALTLRLAMIENAAYRLATNIKKTQKRANALKNILIPRYEELVHFIQNSLEEKEREEFTRLKVIKSWK